MKDYLNEIDDRFPIRKSDKEKSDFFDYVVGELGAGRVRKETLEKKHNNIIIGDPTEAKVIFTAHYDTPATSLVPNVMFPANKVIGMLFHIMYPLAMAIFSLLVAFGVGAVLSLDDSYVVCIYLVLYFAIFFCSTRLITNTHNKNDNTSGVATVLSIAKEMHSDKVAFILFDNEEKGLLGSKAFAKKNIKMLGNKIVVNFDCVGNGDQIIFIAKEKAEGLSEYELLKASFSDNDRFSVHHLPFKKSLGNSDHKSFPCGVGVVASKKGRVVKFITGRIHTPRDTVADSGNIYYLAKNAISFVEKI
ncbi:MAG: M28 family peptidase [Clostridia bacterium]|nr:M28 family peptidase [Clostridia bacterium]